MTRVVIANCDPVFDESMRLSCVGHSGFVVINVMSRHTMASDTLIGQAIINLDTHRELYMGAIHHLKLPLAHFKHEVHDCTGTKLKLSSAAKDVSGFICLSISVPSIYHNMCGWFWLIKDDFLRGTVGEKVWVVLYDKVLYVHNNPYDGYVLQQLNVNEISAITEAKYDKMEISVDGIKITIVKKNAITGGSKTKDLMWAWGDDATKTKGLWRRALIHHHG